MQLGMVMMALGIFRFGISSGSYQNFSRSASYRWGKVNRIGRAPALQFTGPDAETIKLDGVIYPHFKGGLRQVELMRLRAKAAKPMMMVDGLGWVWDRWVIDQVEERKGVFLRDGAPRKIEFTLSLKSYGKDNGVLSSFLGGL